MDSAFFCGIPTSGPPATAVRSSSCPVPPVGQHLTGWKGFGAAPTCDIFDVAAACDLRPAGMDSQKESLPMHFVKNRSISHDVSS